MSEAMILRRGGSGGLPLGGAVLHVNAPLGSAVTFSKGGVTVKTIGPENAHANADGETADYYCSVSSSNFGSWTVTASLNGNSVSSTVTVDSAEQYDVALGYDYVILDRGTMTLAEVQAAWTLTAGGYQSITAATDYYAFNATGASARNSYYTAGVDISGYSTLEVYGYTSHNKAENLFGVIQNTNSPNTYAASMVFGTSAGTLTLDVSALSGVVYPAIKTYAYGGTNSSNYVKYMKLKR